MLTVHECIDIPSPTEGHDAFAHYYLPHLRASSAEGASSSVPYTLQTIRFVARDMVDDDCRSIGDALVHSFDTYGPESCSAVSLREVGVSGNPQVTNAGIGALLRGLLYVARWGEPNVDLIDALEDATIHMPYKSGQRNPLYHLHTLDLQDLREPLSLENQQLAMQLLRATPGLTTLRLPSAVEVPRPQIVDAADAPSPVNSAFEAEERAERELKATIEASPGASYGVKPYYTQEDFCRNAELNGFPAVAKRLVLAAGRENPRVRKAKLSGGMEPEDLEREFPKDWSISSATAVSNCLLFNHSIVFLDFSNNNIGDGATETLSQFLKTNRSVAELVLRSNQIGLRGGLSLNRALVEGRNTTLIELDLQDNNVNDVVVNAFLETVTLGVTGIGTVRLERNCVTPGLVTRLYHALMLNTQPVELKRLVPLLEANDSRAVKIALNSGEDNLDDTSMKVILHAVRNNSNLTLIDVSNNNITDEGAFFLSEMMLCVPSLRKIIAKDNRIGEEGARKMLKAIPRSKNIERVDLKFQDPPIDPQLLTLMDKVAGLSNQPKVVRENGLALTENDSDVVALDLSFPDAGGRRCDDETIETLQVLLQHNTFFVQLNLSRNPGRLTVKSMPLVATIGLRLQILDLSSNELKDADIFDNGFDAMLADRRCQLHTLMLDNNNLTNVVAERFTSIVRSDNDTLTTLSLMCNRRISKEDRDALQFYCDLNTHSKAFKSIILTVEANQDKRIETLDFCFVDKLNASGTSHGFRKEFGDLSAKLLCVALAQNDSIKTVNMCGNRITDVGAVCFARLLRSNVTLTHLDLSYNEITDEGLSEICRSLKHNTTVKVFVFNGNPSKSPEVARSLQQALQANTVAVGTPYTAAINMTGRPSEVGVDPKLQQHAIDRMVGTAILEDALADFRKPSQSHANDV